MTAHELRELAIPGTHERILPIVTRHVPGRARVLDLGAGKGAFSARLLKAGYDIHACDLYPDMFCCPDVECRRVDAEQPLPYEQDSFDAVVAIEVVEHLESHLGLFREVARLLKPGGKFLFTTPNIASLKSRISFLLTGYFYSHGPLDPREHDPVRQHIAAFTPDRYRFILARAGLDMETIETDKFQRSSRWWGWLTPVIRWRAQRRFGPSPGVRLQNSAASLYGRTMVGICSKRADTNAVPSQRCVA